MMSRQASTASTARSSSTQPTDSHLSVSPIHAKNLRGRKKNRKCPLCPQVFSKAEHLARHVRSHTKEKPFQCGICGRTYTRQCVPTAVRRPPADSYCSDTLLRHSRNHSGNEENPLRRSLAPGTQKDSDRGLPLSDQSYESGQLDSQLPASTPNRSPAESASALPGLQLASAPDEHVMRAHRPSEALDPRLRGSYASLSEVPDAVVVPHLGVLPSSDLHLQHPQSRPPLDGLQLMRAPAVAPVNILQDNLCISAEENGNVLQTPTSLDFWDYGFDPHYPSWLAGDDFDLNALNSSIAATISPYIFPQQAMALENDTRTNQTNEVQDDLAVTKSTDYMSKRWFTHLDEGRTGQVTPGKSTPRPSSVQTHVDETYRVNLNNKLRARLSEESLPSTKFLVIDPKRLTD